MKCICTPGVWENNRPRALPANFISICFSAGHDGVAGIRDQTKSLTNMFHVFIHRCRPRIYPRL